MSIRLSVFLIFAVYAFGINCKPLSSSNKLTQRINHLLNITEAEKKFNNVLNAYVTSDPNLSLYKTEIMGFVNQFLSYQSLRPHIVEIYRDLYTLADINGMIKFYTSPLGKKIVEKEGQAETRLTQLIKTQLQKQMPQIVTWFQEKLNTDYSKNQLQGTVKSVI